MTDNTPRQPDPDAVRRFFAFDALVRQTMPPHLAPLRKPWPARLASLCNVPRYVEQAQR